MKPDSHWWKMGDDQDFHDKDKTIIFNVMHGYQTFNDFKALLIRREWLHDPNETLSQSMILVTNMHDAYIKEIPKLLKGCSWLNKLAVHKLADFLVVLFKSDDMYYERMGYLIYRFIQLASVWKDATKEDRMQYLHNERLNYFQQEQRQDRITQLSAGWDYLEHQYATDVGVERSVNWIIQYLGEHKEEFNYDEVSRLKMMQFHPEHWYPNGRGQLWDMVHGGCG